MTDFLRSVLPSEGVYCSVSIKTALIRQEFVPSIDELDVLAANQNAKQIDAYFALAAFKDDTSRKAENVLALRAFFLDIDCGPGKPYAFQTQAAGELRTFIDENGLPDPTIVNSGGGLHVYWTLTDAVTYAEWLPVAKALKALCNAKHLFADPTVTTDGARILRVPGTTNFKDKTNPRAVQIIHQGTPVPFQHFADLMPARGVDLSAAMAYGVDDTTRALAAGDYPTCNFQRIVLKSLKTDSGCAQIKRAIEESATLEEPLWRAALSIAVRCEDGAKAIHKLSKGHPGYNPLDTERKAAETKGPYTCDWYRANYAAGCKGCAHKVSSPLLLGRVVAAAEAVDAKYRVEADVEQHGDAALGEAGTTKVKVVIEIPEYPFPYFRGANGGVYRRVRTDAGDVDEVEIYKDDLYVVNRFFDSDEHGDGDGELALVQLHMPRDGVRQFYTPITTLFTKDKLRDVLIKNGVVAYGNEQLNNIMAYFASSIRKLQEQYAASRTRSQMGWTPDMLGFVVGEIEYTLAGPKLAPPASGTRQLAPKFVPTGSLPVWTSVVDFYDRPGLEPHALGLFFGFGSPLLGLVGGNSVKGFMYHMKSNRSGTGKTTVQMAVNSIFGHPTGLLQTKDDTPAAKVHTMGMHNSIAVTIDEVTNTDDLHLSDLVYGATTGRGRNRMESQANKLRENRTSWCGFTITSANSSIVDRLSQLKSTAEGELKRLLEVEVPLITSASKEEIDAVFTKLATNYGLAGPVFIKYVMANREKVTERILALQKKIDAAMKFDQSDRYYSITLACVFTGATIAKKLGLHNIDVNRVLNWTLRHVGQVKEQIISSAGTPLMIAQETLSAMINENISNTLVFRQVSLTPGVVPEPVQPPRGPLRMRYESDTRRLFIPVSELRSFFTKRQVDVAESIRLLASEGIVLNGGQSYTKRLSAGATGNFSGIGLRCYVINGDAVAIDETTFQPAPAPTPTDSPAT